MIANRTTTLALLMMMLACGLQPAALRAQNNPTDDPARPAEPVVRQAAEPDDDQNADDAVPPTEFGPGETIVGRLESNEDVDRIVLVVPGNQPVLLDIRVVLDSDDGMRMTIGGLLPMLSYANEPVTWRRRIRAKAGRTEMTLRVRTRGSGNWRIETTVLPPDATREVEPNDTPADAVVMTTDGAPMRFELSHPDDPRDQIHLEAPVRAIYHLTIAIDDDLPASEEPRQRRASASLRVFAGESRRTNWDFDIDSLADEFHFYVPLDPGPYRLELVLRGEVVGEGYTISCTPHDVRTSAESEAAAQAAIDRGMTILLDPASDETRGLSHQTAAEAFALCALVDGDAPGGRNDDRIARVKSLIAALAARLTPVEVENAWPGGPLSLLSENMYEHSIATIALAEAVAAGYEDAREPCVAGVRYLLAAQLTPKRCAEWGPVDQGRDLGGWRYTPDSKESDLSVTGWCAIAIYAAAVADIDVPGFVESADEAMKYVDRCIADGGYSYRAGYQNVTGICNSVGSLLTMLFSPDPPNSFALADVDEQLCQGTQCAYGNHNSPSYYWYYATRLNYLRGGYPFEAWRSVAIPQLLRRQNPDGSWDSIHGEHNLGPRYATGIAILVLRLCLRQPPHYLRREVQGF